MNILTRPKSARTKASEDKLKAREDWHKLVVKILVWKDQAGERSAEKISTREWSSYCSKMVEINVTHGKDIIMNDLAELKEFIKSRGGFE